MDPTDPNQLASLASLFQQTLNPEQRKPAEDQIGQLQALALAFYCLLLFSQSQRPRPSASLLPFNLRTYARLDGMLMRKQRTLSSVL